MIDLEGTTSLGEGAIDVDIAIEKCRVAAVLLVGKYRVASGGVVKSSAHAAGLAACPYTPKPAELLSLIPATPEFFASRYSMHSVTPADGTVP